MATKTVVCPECGSPAAPGRYACAECGSLLAAVSAVPRSWGSAATAPATDVAEPATVEAHLPTAVAAEPVALALEPAEGLHAEPADGWTPPPGARTEPAPPSAAGGDLPAWPDRPIMPAAGRPAAPTDLPDQPGNPASVAAVGAAWPPAGDLGPGAMPVERTPAGAWLPPSAFLDGLDPDPAPAAKRGSKGRSVRFGLGSLGDAIEMSNDTPRQVIAAGALAAAIGFALPWANVLAGAGLLGGYFTQWGLAGPGHWIVVALLVGLALVAAGGGRLARLPVGIPAVGLGALLVGLVWPYLFGVLGRSTGVWTVLGGVIVLLVGAGLELGRRHASDTPTAQ